MGGVGALQEVPGRWHCPCGTPAGSPLGPSLGKRLPREEAGSEASDSCPGPARSFPVGRGPEERGAELCSSFRASTASWGGGTGGGLRLPLWPSPPSPMPVVARAWRAGRAGLRLRGDEPGQTGLCQALSFTLSSVTPTHGL